MDSYFLISFLMYYSFQQYICKLHLQFVSNSYGLHIGLQTSGDTYVNYSMIKSMTKICYVKCNVEMEFGRTDLELQEDV